MKSLMMSKSPVIGIPVEGAAPVCIDGRRLRAWAKCVTCQGRTAGSNCESLGHAITPPVENPKALRMGTPVELGVMAPLKFVVVRWGTEEDYNVSFTVTETITGRSVGQGATAEKAILDAHRVVAEQTPEQVQAMMDKIAMEEALRLVDSKFESTATAF